MKTTTGLHFICRVCRSDKGFDNAYASECVVHGSHEDARDTAWIQHGEPSIGFSCLACSALFRDPNLFSLHEQK